MTILLATKNTHKADELSRLLEGIAEIQSLPADYPDIPETGTTLEENALLKAKAAHDALHLPTVADDTGLEVTALNGAPGVYAARYAGESVSYEDNYRKLLKELEGAEDRTAVFSTIICYLDDKGNQLFFRGEVEGKISREPQGGNGFGYDPVFIPTEGDGRTFAEMLSAEKNKLSHRARAIANFVEYLKSRP